MTLKNEAKAAGLTNIKQAVSKIGGEKWLRSFKQRHGIVLHHNGKGLEAIRAKKTQPENYVEFYKKLMKIHGMSQIHEAVRNARSQESALLFEDISPNTNAKWPAAPSELKQSWPTGQELLEQIHAVPGLDKWEPGLVDMNADFFFNLLSN